MQKRRNKPTKGMLNFSNYMRKHIAYNLYFSNWTNHKSDLEADKLEKTELELRK